MATNLPVLHKLELISFSPQSVLKLQALTYLVLLLSWCYMGVALMVLYRQGLDFPGLPRLR